jgi:hypothetical protein
LKYILVLFSFILVLNSCGLSEEEIIRQKEIDEEEVRYDRIEKEFKDNYNLALRALIKDYNINDIYTDSTELSDSLKAEEIMPLVIYFTDISPENKKFDNSIEVLRTGNEFSIKKTELIIQKGLKKKFFITKFEGIKLGTYDFNNNLFPLNVTIDSNSLKFANYGIPTVFGSKYGLNTRAQIDYVSDTDYFILKSPEKVEYKISVPTEKAESFKKEFSSVDSIVLFRIGKTQIMEDFKDECTKRMNGKCILSKKINIKMKKIELIPERNIYFSRWERDDAKIRIPSIYTNIRVVAK